MFWKILFSLWGGILLSLWANVSHSQPLALEEVVARVQAQYETHQDFKAQFHQETTVKSLGRKQQSEGSVFFKKTGKMRWVYEKPTKQEIISDGKTLWNYRPEEKQAIATPMTEAFQAKTPSTFLAGIGNLKGEFKARFLQEPSRGKPYALELTPIEVQGNLEKLFLTVDPRNFKILQARIQDLMGNITQITFSKIQFDNQLPDSLFSFTPPPGTEVITMPAAPSRGGPGK